MEDDVDIASRLRQQAYVDRAVEGHLLQRAVVELDRMRNSDAEFARYLIVANGGAIATVLGLVSDLGASLPLKDGLPSLWLFAAGLIAGGLAKGAETVKNLAAVKRTTEQVERLRTADKSPTDKSLKRIVRTAFIGGLFQGTSAAMFVLGLVWGLWALGRDYLFCLQCFADK